MDNYIKDIDLRILILAGGKGRRMSAAVPKVLCQVAGNPMLWTILDVASQLNPKVVTVVTGGDSNAFKETTQKYPLVVFVKQINQLGTGDAVAAATVSINGIERPSYACGELWAGPMQISKPFQPDQDYTLVLNGDVPLITADLLRHFIQQSLEKEVSLSVLGVEMPDPEGYGRLVVDSRGRLERIVEEKDAGRDEKKIKLCNSGIIFAKTSDLILYLTLISPNNAQGEYYLTDTISEARKREDNVLAYQSKDYRALRGVNSLEQLRGLEKSLGEKQKLKV